MAETWTISEAARLCGCDRRTLQRAIHSGRLHLDDQYRLSREALFAAGYLSADMPQETPHAAPQASGDLAPILEALERLIHAVEGVRHAVDTLRTEMRQTPQGTPHLTPQATPQTDEAPQGTP
jgi:excisionase family DNA binding protein